MNTTRSTGILGAILAAIALAGQGQTLAPAPGAPAANPIGGYKDTPLLPGGKWHVHDPDRPQPPVVRPGTFSTPEKPGQPPSDAIVLFDGTNLDQWRDKDGKASAWAVTNGAMVSAKGDIFTRQDFGDIQLHLEYAEPLPAGASQGRGNSGIFFMGRYELQVLDNYRNPTYPDGAAGALYGQHPPLVNACLPPGEWQVFDAVFTAPRFSPEGELKAPAYLTVFHNGVLIQNHQAYLGATGHRILGSYKPHPPTGPLSLQDHKNPVRFRNIWVRPLAPAE